MAEVFLSLGGNIGEPRQAFAFALQQLEQTGHTILSCSNIYRTKAWGKTDQPDFLNMCVRLLSPLDPHALLALLLRIEQASGRERRDKWGPRPLDLDILTYDSLTLNTPDLTLPHPHMLERAFVLVPLAEIAPDLLVQGKSIQQALSTLDASDIFFE